MDEYEARTPSFGRALSESGRFGNVPRFNSKASECADSQCAEDGLNPQECGDEQRAPIEPESQICGFDKRPLLPLALAGSTFASFACILYLHIPLWAELTGGDCFKPSCFFFVIYTSVLVAMAYTALADPGQIYLAAATDEDRATDDEGRRESPLPSRAHKAWLYSMPIRRYDHYCRWLMNCIGLLNHRSFVFMCGGLLFVTLCGGFMDVLLMFFASSKESWTECWLLFVHLGYCCAVVGLQGPIVWLHIGFVSRNELAYEWNKNFYYVAYSERAGLRVSVNDLSDDEFNDQFDSFEYDQSRNQWDAGVSANCWAFWFTPRHASLELGEF